MSKLVIDVRMWQRGGRGSRLRCSVSGKQCCLGFYGEDCGVESEALINIAMPRNEMSAKWPEWLFKVHIVNLPNVEKTTTSADILAMINDEENISEEQRRTALTRQFKELGDVDVEFVGDEDSGRA